MKQTINETAIRPVIIYEPRWADMSEIKSGMLFGFDMQPTKEQGGGLHAVYLADSDAKRDPDFPNDERRFDVIGHELTYKEKS